MTEQKRSPNQLRALRGLRAYRTATEKNEQAQERQKSKQVKSRSAPRAPRQAAQLSMSEVEAKPKNAKDVETWFREGHWRRIGKKVVVSKWTVPQLSLAARLLAEYGDDLTYEGIQCFFEDFDTFAARQRGRVWVEPTINLLWAMRESVFLHVQRKGIEANVAAKMQNRQARTSRPEDPKNSDEYRPMKLKSNIGWND